MDLYRRWVWMSIGKGYGLVQEKGMDQYRKKLWMSLKDGFG